jgi:bifunctional pyridoxal-dependent enzyme with beta-cystathionase and maltose regulon repressor activities
MSSFAEITDRTTEEELRTGGSLKWTKGGPGVIGAFVAWLDCRALFPAAVSPGDFFLAKARVMLTDGAACGDAGQGHVRLNFATPRPILAEIVRRLAAAARDR